MQFLKLAPLLAVLVSLFISTFLSSENLAVLRGIRARPYFLTIY